MADEQHKTRSAADQLLLERRLRNRRRRTEEVPAGGGDGGAPTVPRRGGDGPAPSSFAQERLWFLDRLQPDAVAYNIPVVLTLEGPLDDRSLDRAVTRLVRRQESLRTRLERTPAEDGAAPVQVVDSPTPVSPPRVDLSALGEGRARREMLRLANDDARRPFRLQGGRLGRFTLVRTAPGRHHLFVTLHHAVADGWSLAIVERELLALYRHPDGAGLPELPVQYADFAVWQRDVLQGEELERQLAYWRRRLQGAPHHLEVPTDRPRGGLRERRGGRHRFAWPPSLATAVETSARRLAASPFMVLLTAWTLLLGRLAAQRDVVVGIPIANRTRWELERLVGFFANTLAMRTAWDDGAGFAALVTAVRDHALVDFAHQDLPFERLVADLRPGRDLAYTPLFQVAFVLLNEPRDGVGDAAAGVRVTERHNVHSGSVKFDLTLNLVPVDGYQGTLEYDRHLFDPTTVQRWLGSLRRLLEAALERPQEPVSRLPLLSPAEHHQITAEWAARPQTLPSLSVPELFARRAAEHPGATALRWRDEGVVAELTYGALARRVDAAAARLAAAGVVPGDAVALAAERGPGLVAAILAILRCGAFYVPLDPAYPRRRLDFMLADTGCRLLVGDGELALDGPPHLRLDELTAAGDGPERSLPPYPPAEAPAYVMYTSGSTGRPKGVVVPHRAVVRLVLDNPFARMDDGETWLLLAPISFDASTLELWAPLLNGGCLAVAPPGRLSPAELGAAIADLGVTAAWLTAGLFHQVAATALPVLGPLRQLLAGGDVLSPAAVERVSGELPGLALVNGYGPTENTTFTCCHRVIPGDGAGPVPVGRPVAGTRVEIVDRHFGPRPAGAVGELCAGGDGLAHGYLGRPALTAERFVPDPRSGRSGVPAGARLYRTGDLARWRADGSVDFVGRRDDQVKIRGFRIEPGEVRTVLEELPGVEEAAVVMRDASAAGKRLVAYLVPSAGGAPEVAAVRAELAGRLPEHMVPSAFVILDALPLTANGKLDRRALPDPEPAVVDAAAYVAPAGPAEELLAELWREVLGVERVGARDDFFALGGHSLLATLLVTRLAERAGVELPLRTLFENPRLEDLARALEARILAADGDGDGAPAAVPGSIPRRPGTGPAPLSFAQERLWFLDRLEPESAAYNIPLVLELRGELDREALAAALARLVGRQESLRTRFRVGDDLRPVQVVDPRRPFVLPRVDLRALTPERTDRERRRLAAAAARRPFDLAGGPLNRFLLLIRADGTHDLFVTQHHGVSDGWSVGILLHELAALYLARTAGTPPALPELPIQYADFAVWQRDVLQGAELERQLAYWRRRLDGAPALLELPTDRPRRALQSRRGDRVTFHWPADRAAAVEGVARRLSASPFMVLLVAFQALLARLSGQRDVVVGTPVANRRRPELENLVGFFANTLVLRTELGAGEGGDGPTFAAVVARARGHLLEDFAHQELPFEELVAELEVERSLSHEPLFQVLFALQNTPPRPPRIPGLELLRMGAGTASAKFDLSLGLSRLEDGFHGHLEYKRDLFDRATVERWLGHLETLLRAAVESPDTAVDELPLLSAAERRAIVAGWNDTGRDFAAPELLHVLVERQVDATPDAPALRFREESLSYRELDGRVNRLARLLAGRGVGPETRVGVAMERSVELVVALHGVVKAGGAYVPVDPGYPAERVRFMLDDALGAGGLLLTQEALVDALAPSVPAGVEVLAVDALGDELAALPATRPAVAVEPENPAYAIYTSGSTGRPKGAVNRHRSIVNRLLWMQETFGLDAEDRVLQKTPYSFDVSVWELFWPFLAGAELVVAEPGGHQDPAYLVRTVREAEITTMHFVPSMLHVFLGEPEVGGCGGALRRVICSGEALAPDLVRGFHRLLGSGGGAGGPRLFNLYGPTEAAVDVTWTPCDDPEPRRVTLGTPVANTRMHVVDRGFRPQPVGVAGELLIGGVQLARGYLGRPGLTAERFVPDPFAAELGTRGGGRVYRTGDLGRYLPNGDIEYLGRLDHQVKVRGLRIELGEIETALTAEPAVREAVVLAHGEGADTRLVAYLVAEGAEPAPAALREHLRRHLPEHMVPTGFVFLDAMPLSPNGKADRKALAAHDPGRPAGAGAATGAPPGGALERRLAALWSKVLGHDAFSVDDNFFDVGGHSLLVVQVQRDLRRELGVEVEVVDLFRFPTLRSLADHLRGAEAGEETPAAPPPSVAGPTAGSGRVAVIGMAGRFPGAPDLDALWANLRDGVESVRRYTLDEMRSFGVPEEQLRHPDFVPVGAELEGADLFDADYFGYAPREAQVIDPQQRVFLETAVAALEDAALDPGRYAGRVGVFGGAAENRHVFRIAADRALLRAVGAYQVLLSNRADYLPTRTAYKLGLTGPAVNVQTACSTSLVAVHVACRALLDGDCDAALAGGSSVGGLTPRGYVWQKGGISSPDGHTRAFDADGRGTTRGHGVGVVVLKRLEDAVADGDPIRAVIAGTAVTNDGKDKVGFTAPSVDGQARAIADAQRRAGVVGGEVDYVEGHGTATELGDPIEVAALRRAFSAGDGTPAPGSVALGSVKTNLGHLDAAAGVTGLIKTVLALEHATLPASLHYREPNPKLDLPASPFRVVAETAPWPAPEGRPRRAGVSSFGVGGTNAHAVVEEAPTRPEPAAGRDAVCLPLSARTPAALDAAAGRLAAWLEERPRLTPADLADAAWTLATGRRELEHRTAVVAADREGAVAALLGEPGESHGVAGRWQGEAAGRPSIAFLLSGQGSQYPAMARGLHAAVTPFRDVFERCRRGLEPHLEVDLAELVFSGGDGAAARLQRTAHAQPALFAVEIALAETWRACGVEPEALLGHSLGEITAACLAGVFELDAALELVATRGRLMEAMEPGSMLAVARSEAEVLELLSRVEGVELAGVNGPDSCVVAGPSAELEAWRSAMEGEGVETRPLHTSHAFHTAAMEPALEPFRRAVEKADPRPPRLPLLSNLTGAWMSAAEATDPEAWVRRLRAPVRFGDGAAALLEEPDRVLLEVGPGRSLATLVRRQPAAAGRTVLTSMRHPRADGPDLAHLLAAAGRLWIAGAGVDWTPLAGEGRRKIHLPTYPFQRRSFWVDDPRPGAEPSDGAAEPPPAVRESAPGEPVAEGAADGSDAGGTAGDSPHGDLERLLIGAWRDLLGGDEISRHDDFFELGGSSLLAVRLASRLKERLGVEVDPHDLVDHPTVAGLAAHLAPRLPAAAPAGDGPSPAAPRRASSPDPLLVCMQPRGDADPLFLVHPAGGHNLYYRYVVRELGDERPVWAFRAQGLEEGEEVLRRVEDVAERYLEALRKVRPEGPYHLFGSSFGGMVAWEMARRLSAAGAAVGSLVLVDTFGPGQLPPRDLVQLPEEGVDSDFFGGARPEELPDLRRIRDVMEANVEAMYRYDPPPWAGRAAFFRASERSHRDEPAHPERAWIDRAEGGLEVHVLPGGHNGMHRPPHAAVLAARLTGLVARGERSSLACPAFSQDQHYTK